MRRGSAGGGGGGGALLQRLVLLRLRERGDAARRRRTRHHGGHLFRELQLVGQGERERPVGDGGPRGRRVQSRRTSGATNNNDLSLAHPFVTAMLKGNSANGPGGGPFTLKGG